MATLSEIVSRYAHIVSPNPTLATLAVVERAVLNYRALLIRRDHERNGFLSDHSIQVLPCLATDDESLSACGIELDCYEKVSVPIPSPIRLKTGYAFRYVGSIDRKTRYTYIDENMARNLKYSRYSKNGKYFTYANNRINLIGVLPELIRVEAAFEDPKMLFDFKDCKGKRLYDIDSEFPLSQDMEQAIGQAYLQGELKFIQDSRENEIHTSSNEDAPRH